MSRAVDSIYVKLLDLEGEVITDRVSRFRYVYAEDENDYLKLDVQVDDPDFVTNEKIAQYQEVEVVWGYTPFPFTKRRVVIQSVVPNFTPNGIILTITGTDKLALLKQIQDDAMYEDSTLQDIVEDKAAKLGLEVKTLYPTAKREFDDDGRIRVAARDRTATFQQVVIPVMVQAGMSDRQLIDKAASLSGDDMVVEGRDNTVTVKKRDYNQNPIAIFEYKKGRGNLLNLEIKPETEKSSSRQNQVVSTGFDPETKTAREVTIDPNQTSGASTSEYVKDPTGMTQQERNRQRLLKLKESMLSEPEAARDANQLSYNRDAVEQFLNNPELKDATEYYLEFGRPMESKLLGGYRTAARDNTAYVIGTTVPRALLPTPEDTEEEQGAETRNFLDKFNFKGTIKVLGSPDYVSGKVITLSNVSKTYSGNWYVGKVTHTLDNNGYICEMEIGKHGPETVFNFEDYQKARGDVNTNTETVAARQNSVNQTNV